MSARRAGLLGGVAIAAGVAAALWWWRSSGDETPAARTDPEPAPQRPAPAVAADIAEPPSATWLDRDEDPVGAERMEGQVVDGDEVPVGNALVAIDSVPPRTTTTETDGSFAFDRLTPRSYRLVAHADDRTAGPVDARLTARSEPVILRLRRAATLRATVVDADTDRPIADAVVQLRGVIPRDARTDADGVAALRGVGRGDYVAVVSAQGYATERRAVELSGMPDEVREARFALRPGTTASGVVLTEAGSPVAGARVVAQEVSTLFVRPDLRLDSVVTDGKGRWSIASLSPGTYRFHARHSAHAPAVSAPVSLERGADRAGVVITVAPAARIRGRVVTVEGEPVGSAVVRIASAAVETEPTRQTYTDDDGRFDIGALPRKSLVIVALAEGAASELRTVDLAATPNLADVTLTLTLTGAIAGIVVDQAGTPVPEALVRAFPSASTDTTQDVTYRLRQFSAVIADSGGRFRFAGLPDARYLVRAGPPGTSRDALWLQPPTEAHPGDEAVRVVLRPSGSIAGRAAFADGKVPEVFTVRIHGGTPVPVASKDGAFEIPDVPPGNHGFQIAGPEFTPKTISDIDVAPGKATDVGTITVDRGRIVSGRVLDPGGAPVADAQVVMARELFGDGQSITTIENGGGILLRQTASGPDGRYLVRGVPNRELSRGAEHGDVGRSTPIVIPPAGADLTRDLTLQPFGALEGAVTLGGQPAEGAVVGLRVRSAPNTRNTLIVGPDGTYRFDRIASGEYLVFAFLEAGGQLSGSVSESVTATVEAGKTARVFIDLPLGGVTVHLLGDPMEDGVKSMYLVMAEGEFDIDHATIDEMRQALSQAGGGSVKEGFALPGQPLSFENVLPGPYGACSVGLGVDPDDVAAMDELFRETDRIRGRCIQVTITESPEEQKVSMPVELIDLHKPDAAP